jgi:hypothetical protein
VRKITIEIETGNAAFGDDPGEEIARILGEIGDKLVEGRPAGSIPPLFDWNGQRVGTVTVE